MEHNESFLFLKCGHDICIKGIEEILLTKFKLMCNLIYNRDLVRLNQLSFNVGCGSECFVKNVYDFETFTGSAFEIWKSFKFDDKMWMNIIFLYNGSPLKFDICKGRCGKVILGYHQC